MCNYVERDLECINHLDCLLRHLGHVWSGCVFDKLGGLFWWMALLIHFIRAVIPTVQHCFLFFVEDWKLFRIAVFWIHFKKFQIWNIKSIMNTWSGIHSYGDIVCCEKSNLAIILYILLDTTNSSLSSKQSPALKHLGVISLSHKIVH